LCNPTLVAIGSLTGEGQALGQKFASYGRVSSRLSRGGIEKLRNVLPIGCDGGNWQFAFDGVKRLHEEGADIIT
jgi:hypothetical protein